MPSHNHDFDERDLSEAPRLAKDSQPPGLIIGGGIAVVFFLGMLAYGSLPELSPQEIVSMDGYAGEQPTKHIFNIDSLEEAAADEKLAEAPAVINQSNPDQSAEQSVAEVETDGQEMAKPEAVAELETPIETPIETTVSEPDVVASVQPTPVETVRPQPIDEAVVQAAPLPQAEIANEEVVISEQASEPVVTTVATRAIAPASLFGRDQEERVVAALATTPTIDESADTVVVSSVAAIEPVPAPTGSSAIPAGSKGKLLPLRSVLADFTELKASPTRQSKTLLSLGRGVIVTAFERRGKWIHIGTNDGSSITGYVLESSLGRVDTKNSG